MTQVISKKRHWKEILVQQKLANAHRWLALVKSHEDPSALVSADYDNFLRALETTLQNSDTFDLAYQLIQSIFTIALDYADWDRWLIYLDSALKTSRQLNRKSEQATLSVQKGDILYRKADLQRAETLYEGAAEIFKELDDLASYAGTLTKLAVLYEQKGNLQKGISLCKKALSIAGSLQNDLVISQINQNLSSIYYRSRDWKLAREAAQKAYNYYKEHGPPKYARKAMMNIIAIWAELGEWGKIEQEAVALMDTLNASGDIRTLSQLKNNLGVVAFNQTHYKVAERFWQEALHLHSQIQEPSEQAALYNNLGVVYTLMKEWQAAYEMLNKAIKAHQQLGDVYNWANSLDNLADLYEAQGETAVCRQVLEEAQIGLQPIAETPHAQELINSITQRLKSLPPEG
jgi:tetratricopeptide (TPR) repeat protein